MACVHVLDPLEPGTVLERVAELPKLGGALVRMNRDVRKLGRHDDETKDRGDRQIRHGERLTDEIAARADVRLELVERRAPSRATPRRSPVGSGSATSRLARTAE